MNQQRHPVLFRLVLLVLPAALGCDNRVEEPTLRTCTDSDCIAEAPAEDGPCKALTKSEPGAAIYVVHALADDARLADDVEGTLTVTDICGSTERSLSYADATDSSGPTAITPLVLPAHAGCGFSIQVELQGHSASCTRPIDAEPAACAEALATCPPPQDEEEEDAEGGEAEADGDGTTTGNGEAEAGGADGTTSGAGDDAAPMMTTTGE